MPKKSEFERSKDRHAKNLKRHDEWKETQEPQKPAKTTGSSVTVVINDCGSEFKMVYEIPNLSQTRLASRRTHKIYLETVGKFVKKEFGKWRSLQIL